jgi:hypothetical protein
LSLHEFHIFQEGRISVTRHMEDWMGLFRQIGALMGQHPELSKALERYPGGLQTMEEESKAECAWPRPHDTDEHRVFGGMGLGGRGKLEYGWALLRAEETRDFSEPLEYAIACYLEDRNARDPNQAPKAFWSSTAKYRELFHKMGKILGEVAEGQLDKVPDAELRLFAQIEFAAGLCGLPEMKSMVQRTSGPRSKSQSAD